LRSATESTERSIFQNAPFLQDPVSLVSKVDSTFLKDHTPPHELDSSGREQGLVVGRCDLPKRDLFGRFDKSRLVWLAAIVEV
jgi:hypothetical protein